MIKPLVLDSKRKEESVSPSTKLKTLRHVRSSHATHEPRAPLLSRHPRVRQALTGLHITERKVQARGAATALGATAKKPVTSHAGTTARRPWSTELII